MEEHTGFDGLDYTSCDSLEEFHIRNKKLNDGDWVRISNGVALMPTRMLTKFVIETEKVEH